MTKILALSDIHGDMERIEIAVKKAKTENADVIIISGDLTMAGQEIPGLLKPLNELGKPILIIPGNHDTPELTKFLSYVYNNIHNLNGYYFVHDGIGFFGCAGTGLGYFGLRDETILQTLEKSNEKISELEKRVMIVHEPPYKTKLDWIGFHAGNKGVREAIQKLKPTIVVHGHIHETFGMTDKLNGTEIINAGHDGCIIEL